jgi:hypothetical protein
MSETRQSRRQFLVHAAAAAAAAGGFPRIVRAESDAAKAARSITGEPSLVPGARNTAPDYYCTWNAQGFVVSYENALVQADAMIEANLFGNGPNQNWVEFFPDARDDLYFVLDDAFDMPIGGGRSHPMRGSLELDAGRFPSYRGTPAERLERLNRNTRGRGWRAAGLWVLSAPARARTDPNANEEEYWAERLDWSREAGIDYWKVDWGRYNHREIWRLNQWARRHNPAVWIEHGAFSRDGSRIWLADKVAVLRTYDVHPSHSVRVTISRVAGMLRHPREDRTSAGLINCEDEVYIGAGLGCAYGVMRHPLAGNMPNGKPDKFFTTAARDLKRRIDEVTRAVRWHRIAHPFGVTDRELVDAEEFRESPQAEGVPCRVARGGLPLPTVVMRDGLAAPYVLCSRHPDGEIAMATIPRRTPAGEVIHPAEITLQVGALDRPVGVFGRYGSLTLVATGDLAGKRILAQDLAGKTPVDITDEVKVAGGRLTIPGGVIERVGLMAGKPGDLSDPGLVLAVEGLTRYVPKKPMTPHNFDAVPLRPLPVAEPAGPLTIHRALWGPVTGGADVTERVAGMVKDGGLRIDAIPEVLGDDGSNPLHLRLEVEYTCNGKAAVSLAVYGDLLTIRPDGSYRADRVNR